ncbi:MAG: response regulator [Deltaproteobacteria bacterium]|nr:response regulator [Deltaproteobacteria bacterium]
MPQNAKKNEEKKERKRAIRRPRLMQRRSIRVSATAGWVWDVATGAAAFAPEWRDVLAVPAGMRQGGTLEYLFSRMRKADRDLLRKECAEIASGYKDALDIAVRMRRFDNTWAWILLRGKLEDTAGAPGIFAGVGIEVSRLRLDKRFFPPSREDSPTTYLTLLEHSPNNIVRYDRELFPLYVNPAVSTFIPCTPEELGSKKVADIGTSAPDIDFIQTHVDRVFETGEVVQVRRNITTETGAQVGEFTFWPEFDENGSVRSVICMMQDLTAEVKREKEAQTNEMRFSALYQLTQMDDAPEEEVLRFVVEKVAELTGSRYSHLHILPGILNPRGRIIWSKSHTALLTRDELDKPDSRLIRGEFGMDVNRSPEPSVPVCENRGVTGSSNIFFKGKLPISRFLCAPALEEGRPMCIAAVYNKDEDYTEADMRQLQMFISGAWLVLRRRSHVAELRQAKESAELANKVKDRFLANVSHELRTPLNGMLSMLQLLEMTPLAQDQVEYARSATTTGQTLLRIISDILDYSKMESGRLELDMNPFNFKESLVSTIDLFQAAAREKGLTLTLNTIGNFHALVHGDEARVRQILFNLVGNSLKFTDSGEIEISCEAREKGGSVLEVHLTVRDTGIGIPLEMQEKVFDAFTQVDGSSTRKHQGSGLGLGIVRLLTKAMGGTISLKSTPGSGTFVTCVIPFRIVPGKIAEEKDGSAAEAAFPACPPLNVLVAEDDAVSRHAMRLFLEKLGHRAVCVTNGREALEALRLYPFGCLISDVLMPEMDGLEVTRHIREGLADSFAPSAAVHAMVAAVVPAEDILAEPRSIPRDVPVVAVSAHAMTGDREHFLAQGMDYYLSKPTKLKDLAAVLLRVHERHPAAPIGRTDKARAGA